MTLITTQTIATDKAGDEPAIEVRGLCKSYGKTEAVAGIDLSIGRGEIFGLIGPDGAGKTTTFGILAGVLPPSSGQVRVLGLSARDARLATGYLTQRFSLYLDLSIDENLHYSAGLREVGPEDFEARRTRYLGLMGLERFGERLAGQLSGGMKQKLALCCALIAQPQVLLLDEPTTGVDPVSRREFWEVLGELAAEEAVTVVVATPYLDEAERCDRVALMYEGRIAEAGTPAQLRESLGLARLEVRVPELAAAEEVLSAATGEEGRLVDVQTFGDRLDVLVEDVQAGEAYIRSLLNQWQQEGIHIEAAEPTLENVFVARLRQQGSDPRRIPFPGSKGQRTTQVSGSAIEAMGLSKVFGSFQAVKDVTLQVGYGEIYGLLGANGAGKTTTIKMLCGLVPPSAGKISLAGCSDGLRAPALRARIGYMSQKFTLYDDLTILENLQFYSGVYGIPRHQRKHKIDWVLATCGLEDQRDLSTGRLPGGWKQRVAFGASVMHEPEVLFLDEPTSGVDPLARRQFWRLIEEFARKGTAVLVTTHYLEEAEHCNRLGLMVAGEVVVEGTPGELKAEQPGQLVEVVSADVRSSARVLKEKLESWRVSVFGDRLHIVLDESAEQIPQIRALLEAARLEVRSVRPIPFSLEDAFIGTVQRAERRER